MYSCKNLFTHLITVIIISVLFDTCIHLNLEDQIVFDSAVQSFSYISAG